MTDHPTAGERTQRRGFLKSAGVSAAVLAGSQLPAVHAGGDDATDIHIGVIGCGGRGTGAVINALGAASKVIYPDSGYHTEDVAEGTEVRNKRIQVVALADMFTDRLERCRRQVKKLGFDIPDERCFTGFDAYKDLLAIDDVNYVILATPPAFRPTQFEAAVAAGKHVFMEKPVAVDVPGVRTVLRAGRMAEENGLGVAAGTQRRHQPSYQETIARIQDGAIGEILSARCYWNGGQIWVVNRRDGWSDMEWQVRNWNYFRWLSGDHYVEQHVHNLDIMNWVLGEHPVRATFGLGGRQVRTDERFGNIYDHFAVEFEYPSGVVMNSQARQINRCHNRVGEMVVGTKGQSNCGDWIGVRGGDDWTYDRRDTSAYELEHQDLIRSIREGNPINDARAVAEATMTGIIGREATYSGQVVEWDKAMESEMVLGPDVLAMGDVPVAPVPMPGKYRFG